MKKWIVMIICSSLFSASFAQVQRKQKPAAAADSATAVNMANDKQDMGMDKKEMMRELNLTKEQKVKLKTARQELKAKREAVEADDKLSEADKKAKLKELHQEQAKSTMSILNKEQKIKLLKMRREKKGAKMDEMEVE